MSRFFLSTTESGDKHIPIKPGKLLFEIKSIKKEPNSLLESKLGDTDVTFRVGCNNFHGHKSTFQSMSSVLKRCFELSSQGLTERNPFQFDGVLKLTQNSTSGLTITVDSTEDVFKPFMDYCYGAGISVPIKTLPSLCLLSKRLDVPSLYTSCAAYLSRHVSVDIIGELCRLVRFSALRGHHNSDTSEADPELHLASAVHHFLLQKADLVASSSTGQLGSRLLVNLTLELDDPVNERNCSPACPDGHSAFSVLRWCHERVLLGERLARSGSEENVLSGDEDEDAGGPACTIGAKNGRDGVSDEVSRPDPIGKRRFHSGGARPAVSSRQPTKGGVDLESRSSTDDDEDDLLSNWERIKLERRQSTRDVRIALEMCDLNDLEINVVIPEDFDQSNGDGHTGFQILAHCPRNGGAETETCLLAPTSLGAGATSIWLGKLTGQLVSLSVKTCRPPPCLAGHEVRSASLISLLSGDRVPAALNLSGASSNSDLSKVNGVNGVSGSLEDEAGLTVTPTSASHLAKAAATATTLSTWEAEGEEQLVATRLLEARSGGGAGLLSASACLRGNGDDKELLLLLVVGGYTRRGCLDSVELLARCGLASLSPPVPGPPLSRLRGRLAVATTCEGAEGVVYACAGSNGSVDLASVERLTSESLSDWLSRQVESDPSSPLGKSLSSSSEKNVWQTVRRLNQARSSPCAVGLPPGSTSVGSGSLLVAGGVSGATALASVECFHPARDEWIRLPDMLGGRVGASCALLPSRQLVVVAGGTSTAITGATCYPGFTPLPACVEALDLRTPSWSILPSPPPSLGTTGLRGCCLLSSQDELLMVGGFNGRETLDTVWRFDSTAWRWDAYTTLKTSRSGACGVTWPDQSGSIIAGGFNMAVSPTEFLDSLEVIGPF